MPRPAIEFVKRLQDFIDGDWRSQPGRRSQ
jgi:hypothetical protein